MKLDLKRIVPALLILFVLVVLDLLTKYFMASKFFLGETKQIIPGLFNLVLAHNTGAAFSIGTHLPKAFFLIVSLVAIGVVIHLFLHLKPNEKFSSWGLVFILSGAIGNVIDRVRLGYVVDFIQVFYKTHYWPSFNLADSWITIGAVLFGLDLLIFNKSKKGFE